MVGGNDVRHGLIGMVGTRQFKAFSNDCFRMVALVATVKIIVLRKDGLVDIDI